MFCFQTFQKKKKSKSFKFEKMDEEIEGSVPVGKGKAPKLPKMAKVKNKAPADLQLTAEQLLREAKERQLEIVPAPPKQKIQDTEELKDYQMRKRKEFEDNIRKNRTVMTNWFKYAKWEEVQNEIDRSRSVYERALDTDHRNITLWLKYAEMEMKNKQVNHARNLWDRAVTIQPRANQLWLKYTYMEEMLENIPACRAIYERWMEWQPEDQYWLTYINFEMRYKEIDRAREIFERFVYVHPEVKNWIKFAKFEQRHGFINSSRKIYERAIEFFGEEYMDETLFIGFAQFEESQKEHERARVIYKYALDKMPKDKCADLYKAYTIHEKKFGEKVGIENVIMKKRRLQYEEEITEDPMNYDAWFDLIRLVENEGEVDTIRETYERAIANIPPSKEKRFWRRYIYLWINYAVYEELEANDVERARQVYRTCLDIIPHKRFTFAKIWLLYAQFEIRQKDVQAARRALGTGLGKCPKGKLFRGYIDLEIQLREFQRCRTLYEKFLLFDPENCSAWMKFAELEGLLGDAERARGIFELAVNQPRLDMPELLWKQYIDFEIEQEETDYARQLYKRLLNKTSHVKVWLSLAQFELQTTEASEAEEANIMRARKVYEEANQRLREAANMAGPDEPQGKEFRLMLLESWRDFEREQSDDEALKKVNDLMPKRVKKRRKIEQDSDAPGVSGDSGGWEEYFDYIFPEDEGAKPGLKLLEKAKEWKRKMKEIEAQKALEEEQQRIPITDDKPVNEENPDADDEDIRNESSSEDEDEEDTDEPNAKRVKKESAEENSS